VTAPVAVFGVGNRSRGDDALGPALLDRLAGWLEARGLASGFDLFEAYQLQVENALDLEGRELALFIDAWRGAPVAAALRRVGAEVTALSSDSHRLAPAAVLEVHRRVTGRAPPPAFVLGVRAERFELGEGLSEASRMALDEAWPLLESLAGDPRLASWQAQASTSRD
jgi:hydrogenase maturation protease